MCKGILYKAEGVYKSNILEEVFRDLVGKISEEELLYFFVK